MPVLSVYTAGVSTTGMEIINDAVTQAFGECDVEELGRDNLRYKVRSGSRNTSVVLIILDTTSMEECKDIEDGLYNSSKFYNYVDDKQLVEYLNDMYGLSLDVDDEVLAVANSSEGITGIGVADDRVELVEKYTSQLNDKDSIIRTLNAHITELQTIVNEGGYSINNEELENTQNENLELKNRISDLINTISELKQKLKDKEVTESELNGTVTSIKEKLTKVENSYKTVNKELADERVISSQKSGVIRDKDRDIERLSSKISEYEKTIRVNESYESKIAELERVVKVLRLDINNLNIDISSKDSEIVRLRSDLSAKGEISEQVGRYKELLEKSELEKSDAIKRFEEIQANYNEVAEKHNSLVDELDDYDRRFAELQRKYEECEGFLAKANSDKIALEEKNRLLKQSVNGDDYIDSTMSELSELRKKYTELQMNVFNIISTKSLPHSNVKVPLVRGICDRVKNIRFQFSGNSESRKGTYKCMYNEFMGITNEKFLIVDVTSETAIDYVFQMRSIVDGMPWFSSGGGVQKYLSSTCLPNVKVLMPKLGYINDSYFLTVNWEQRLKELENSGYKVVLYCGDISNLVGRVLLETFSDIGNTAVYVHGNALGSRSIIANSSGLSGIKSCLIAYYDFDKNMSKFYDVMNKKCQCKIISYARGINQ